MKAKQSNTNKSQIDSFVIDKVKELRIAKGFSQAVLAYEINVTAGFIGKAESPAYATHYNLKHLNDIAKVLECSPQEFLPKTAL